MSFVKNSEDIKESLMDVICVQTLMDMVNESHVEHMHVSSDDIRKHQNVFF